MKKAPILALIVSAVLLAGVLLLRNLFPPVRAVSNPRLDALRAELEALRPYNQANVDDTAARLTQLRADLWTPETFALWRKELPEGWIVQDLGPTDTQHVRGRRYAFQRPGATDFHWSEVLGTLRRLETAPCVSVTSVALAVGSTYQTSRRFTQCQLIAVFYFAKDQQAAAGTPPIPAAAAAAVPAAPFAAPSQTPAPTASTPATPPPAGESATF